MSQLQLHHGAVAQPQGSSAPFALTVPGAAPKLGCGGRVQVLVIAHSCLQGASLTSPKSQAPLRRHRANAPGRGGRPLPCMKCTAGFACVAETCGSGAGISRQAMRGAIQARRAQSQLGRQFSVMFLLGGFHMPMVSRGRIHA